MMISSGVIEFLHHPMKIQAELMKLILKGFKMMHHYQICGIHEDPQLKLAFML